MNKPHTATFDSTLAGASAFTGSEYYHLSRVRTRTADVVLEGFAAVVSAVALTGKFNRSELFEKYDVKLWSYNDSLVLFTLATLPSVAALATLFAAHRGVEAVRSAFPL